MKRCPYFNSHWIECIKAVRVGSVENLHGISIFGLFYVCWNAVCPQHLIARNPCTSSSYGNFSHIVAGQCCHHTTNLKGHKMLFKMENAYCAYKPSYEIRSIIGCNLGWTLYRLFSFLASRAVQAVKIACTFKRVPHLFWITVEDCKQRYDVWLYNDKDFLV